MTATGARHGAFLVALLALQLLPARPSHAYVRAVTSLGTPVWWRSPSIAITIYLGAPPPKMTLDEYWHASQMAAQAWGHGAIACTALTINISKEEVATAEVGFDRVNVIVLRRDSWCQPIDPADPAPPPCYPANAMAVTTLFKNKTTGEIVDADMEINAMSFAWADLVANPELADGRTADFQNTLTHELGHVIGLAHTCYSSNDGPTPLLDNTGKPEIVCGSSNVPASVTSSTMFPVVATSDTERRTLSPDDTLAACEIYPNPMAILAGSGCAVSGPPSSKPDRGWLGGLVCFVAFVMAVTAFCRPRKSA